MPLNVIGLASSSIAGGCLVIGLAHVVFGLKNRWQVTHLALALIAMSVAALTVGELLLLDARTPQRLEIARWMHLPAFILMASVLVFVNAYFRAGRSWLACAAFGLGTAAVASSFLFDSALASEIHALEKDDPIEEAHPWAWIGELGALLTLLFIVDAVIADWRRGGLASRKRAVIVGGSLLLSGSVVAGNAMLMRRGLADAAYLFWVFGLVSITAICIELREEILRRVGLANELKRTSAALGHSRRQMDTVLEAASVGLWEWDCDRDKIWVNERAREQFGFAAGETIDFERFLAAVHGDDRSSVRQSVMASIKDGGLFRCEYRVPQQGAIRWISAQGSVEAGGNGQQSVLRGITLDVSGQKLADQRFRQVVEAAPTGMLIMDSAGKIVLVNTQIELDFGRSRNELVGQRLELLIPGHPCADRSLNTLCEVTGCHGDGSQIPMSMVVASVPSMGGGELLVCLSNLSDRQRRDELLQRERHFLRQVLDANPGLIFAKDRHGRFTLANRAVAEVYGTTVEALIGKTDGDFNRDPQQVENFRKADLEVLDTLQPKLILEESITDAAGKTRWLQTIKLPVLDRNGDASVVLGTSTDITERKRAELDLAHQRNELAHLSRVMMLSELSGSIAHELNQPLTAILSNAQAGIRYLSRDPIDVEELSDILEDVAGDSKRAGEIIRGLRQLLKKDPAQFEPLDANLMVQDVLRLLRSDMLNAGVRCGTELALNLPFVIGARVQLQQVLMNLIVNACDAMSETSGARLLMVSTELVDGNRVQCCVKDSGPGITRERAARLFEPFFTTKPAGMGLGLPVSRKIIEAHGGQIWAEHDRADGAAFCFTIPYQRGE